ncbi:hypothetical protein SODALDRAFT_345501 [Sodiomyces alkalinus F11]|uniref:Carbohydrate kinase PfkB domain-containing protein n=1 Tax=Sodiomyces alkalinus (strain CBS 110278 / VKM F-3762 / F11) TaxID=1314773 RepID=A0A3N2PQS0_SODAK|nr:hypothetical protein SODALDRAFT_345501 [Sodiomyces alkalinus F11]ROT36825.1 hypothetical protein SODALDRAFT_345501 [Sodiomyces alkalinus F11]
MEASRLSSSTRLLRPAHRAPPPSLKDFLKISDEVADAVATNKPVVALESTIYTHGALGNDLGLEEIVRQGGAVPAVCGILDGRPTVGLTSDEVARMVESGTAKKASRRDIAYLAGLGFVNRKLHGGTTIAGTMLLARLAGIRVFGTGGLGGVHRDGENSMDISADLTELGRTRVAVISAGCKGFLDIPRTLEYLETQGALVATFADQSQNQNQPGSGSGSGAAAVEFPAFWARYSGVKSPAVVESERDAAAMILAQETLGIESGMLFANPIPEEHAIPRAEMDAIIETAVREAAEKGFTGAANTPYVLQVIRDMTGERSTLANKVLVRSNVERATRVAVELSRLLAGEEPAGPASAQQQQEEEQPKTHFIVFGREKTPVTQPSTSLSEPAKADILVAGSVAVDLSCDYHPLAHSKAKGKAPQLETSNPAAISQTVGGVGHNVALAAHRVSQDSRVRLCSLIGDDTAGSTVVNSLQASGLDTTYIRTLGHDYHASARTAQYVAINDADKNLVLAMADMGIFTNHSFPDYWKSAVAGTKPKWLVVDGNWNPRDIRAWVSAGRAHNCSVAFEPVSTAKSVGLFAREHLDGTGVFPACPAVDLASPNHHELAAMWAAAKENGFFDTPRWWEVVDAFGLLGARDRFLRITASAEITDAGVPVQCVQLLPYVPTIVAKLGSRGCLLTTVLGRDDPRLRDAREEEWILTRSLNDHPHVGGIYMRMFPPVENVEDIVSVNGVGDTFLGVLVAGLAKGGRVEKLIDVAQKGAVLTLKSHESVSPDLGSSENGASSQPTLIGLPTHQQDFEGFSDESSVEEEVNSSEDESEPEILTNHQPNKTVTAKDAEEEELERLVLGDRRTFRDQLFNHDPLSDLELLEKRRQLQLAEPEEPGLEDVPDTDLFFLDTAAPTAPGEQAAQAKAQDEAGRVDGDAPAWEDSDDERLTVSLAGVSQLRKLRIAESEDVVSGAEYARRLRRQYLTLHPLPAWAKAAEGRPAKRRRRSSATGSDGSASSAEEDEGEDEDGEDLDMEAAPLDRFMRDVAKLAGTAGAGAGQKRKLRPEVLDIQRTRPLADTHKAAVNNLSFHPSYPVLLSSSVSSVLLLHHINPTAHPTPNPLLTSVQAKLIDVRRAEFLYPAGEQVFFAGRRRYFHSWHLQSGVVEKTTRIQGGHRAEHKSMEHFRLSPCGRYMGIVASTRKGGGLVNIVSVASRQWVAAARLDSRHGVADFAWWSTGEGLSILGRDGSVGEYSMAERRFLGVWRDEGCVGGIVIALGGHQGPGVLGDDRWVAVGSNSGVTNIYDRNELFVAGSGNKKVGGKAGAGGVEEVTIKATPEPARRFEQLVTPITVLAFSPDGQLMAFGSREKKDALRLVHLPSCTVYRNWPTENTPLGRITSVAFGRGSDLLAVGNDAGKVRLWDIRS